MCLQPEALGPGVAAELIRMCTLDASQQAAYPMQIFECLMSIQMCIVIARLQGTKLECFEFMSLDRAFFMNLGEN